MEEYMQGNISCFPEHESLCRGVAIEFVRLYQQCIFLHGEMNVALSGGGTPKNLYQLFANEYCNVLEWNKVNFYFGDERHVSMSHKDSNFNMVNNILFGPCDISKDCVYSVNTEHEPDISASIYGETLLKNLPVQNNIPRFDLVLLGMGADGHTASLFTTDTLRDERIVVASYVEKLDSWRISLNYNVLNNANNVWVLISGAEKKSMFSQLQSNMAQNTPISKISPRGELHWFVDEAACNECSEKSSPR